MEPQQPQPSQPFGVNNPNPIQPAQGSPMHNPLPPSKVHLPTVADKVEQAIMLFYVFVAALLVFRFALSLFAANRTAVFVDFVYQLTTPFMFPFEGMFGAPPGVGDFRLEFEVIVALFVYALIFFGIARLVKILFK